MAQKYLDNIGLSYFWSKIKERLNSKVDKEDGKGLSTNDYTNEDKNKLNSIEVGDHMHIKKVTEFSTPAITTHTFRSFEEGMYYYNNWIYPSEEEHDERCGINGLFSVTNFTNEEGTLTGQQVTCFTTGIEIDFYYLDNYYDIVPVGNIASAKDYEDYMSGSGGGPV